MVAHYENLLTWYDIWNWTPLATKLLNTSRSSGKESNQYYGQDILTEKKPECNSKRYQQP